MTNSITITASPLPENGISKPEEINKAIEDIKITAEEYDKDVRPTKDLYPLSTNKEELFAFQQYLKDEINFLENDKPLNITWAERLFYDPRAIISKLNNEAYWKFRNFQIQQMQRFLRDRLNLNEAGTDYEWAICELTTCLGKKASLEDRKQYLQQMLKLMENVSISYDSPTSASIKKGDETLVAITENTQHGLNNMDFELAEAVLKSGDEQKINHAVELMLDQATRMLERSLDPEKELIISGYEDNPDLVLKIYNSAMLHGLQPKIDQNTLDYWNNNTDPKYQDAINKYQQLLKIQNKPGLVTKTTQEETKRRLSM